MNLILLSKAELEKEGGLAFASLTGRIHIHCQQVLKLKVGAVVRVGVLAGGVGEAEVVSMGVDYTRLKLLSRIDLERPPKTRSGLEIDLLVAIPRPKVLDRVVQLCGNLGVRRVFLICSERVEKGFISSSRLRQEHLHEQLKLGMEQGMLTRAPELHLFTSWAGFWVTLEKAEDWQRLHLRRMKMKSNLDHFTSPTHDYPQGVAPMVAAGAADSEDDLRAAVDAAAAAAEVYGEYRAIAEAAAARARASAGSPEEHITKKEAADAAALAEAAVSVASDGAFAHFWLPSLRLLAHPGVSKTLPSILLDFNRPRESFQQHRSGPAHLHSPAVLMAIGPEGGWIPGEVEMLTQKLGCIPFKLSDKVLKCETAMVACITQLTMCMQDPVLSDMVRPFQLVISECRASVYSSSGSVSCSEGSCQVSTPCSAETQRVEPTLRDHSSASPVANMLLKEPGGVSKRPPSTVSRDMLRDDDGFCFSFPRRYTTGCSVDVC